MDYRSILLQMGYQWPCPKVHRLPEGRLMLQSRMLYVVREEKVLCTTSVSISSRSDPVLLVLLQYSLQCTGMCKYISSEEKEIFPFQDLDVSV